MYRLACSWLVLLLAVAASTSAPVPWSKPKRPAKQAVFDRLKHELRERGVSVVDVRSADAMTWEVKFTTTRAACLVGIRGKVFSSRIKARDRAEALEKLLRRCREEDEEMTRRLRASGAIP